MKKKIIGGREEDILLPIEEKSYSEKNKNRKLSYSVVYDYLFHGEDKMNWKNKEKVK